MSTRPTEQRPEELRALQQAAWAQALMAPHVMKASTGSAGAAVWQATRRSMPALRAWLLETCGWGLQATSDHGAVRVIRDAETLARAGAQLGEENDDPAVLECLLRLLATVERFQRAQFTLNDAAATITRDSETRPGGPLTWTSKQERASLVAATKRLFALGLLDSFDDTDEQLVEYENADVDVATAPLLRWRADAFLWWGVPPLVDRSPASPLRRAWRWLLTMPTLHRADDPEAFAAAMDYRTTIAHEAERHLGWTLEVHAHSLSLLRDGERDAAEVAPGERPYSLTGLEQLLLLCCHAWIASVRAGTLPVSPTGTILLSRGTLDTHIKAVRRTFAPWLPNTLGLKSDERVTRELLNLANAWGLAAPTPDGRWALYESLARIPGTFVPTETAVPPLPLCTPTGVRIEPSGTSPALFVPPPLP